MRGCYWIIFLSLYRLDVGMNEYRSRNGAGNHGCGGSNGRDGWVVIWFRSGKCPGDEHWTFL